MIAETKAPAPAETVTETQSFEDRSGKPWTDSEITDLLTAYYDPDGIAYQLVVINNAGKSDKKANELVSASHS